MLGRYLLFLLLFVNITSCSDGSDNNGPTLSFADQPGAIAVGRKTDVVLHDDTRNRNLTTTYWYPTNGANQGPLQATEGAPLIDGERKFPLIVLMHGINDNAPGTWSYLGPHLASHGYIVIAPSNGTDIANHPADISYLIDTALGENGAKGMFTGRVAREQILVGGYSFGGLATYMFAYEPQYQDPRTSAVVIMAGIATSAAPINPGLKLMAIYGTEDLLIPYDTGLNFYEAANAPKYLVSLQGGGHVGFTGSHESNIGASMDHLRQKSLTRIAVFAFASSLFADSETDREAARHFLQEELTMENPDAQVMFE